MKRFIPIALASAVLAFAALAPLIGEHKAAAVPAPPNDNFTNAVAIASLPFNDLNVNTSGATTEAGEPSPGPEPSWGDCTAITKTVWYTFTPSANVVLQGDTFGSSFDTVLAVYTGGSLATLTNVACNDDDAGSGGLQSKVVFAATAGVAYRFQVGGFPGLDESGFLDFHLAVASAPLNDDFANAEAIAAIPFTAGPFGTDGATFQPGEPPSCSTIEKTVWYEFTPSVDTVLQADTLASDYDTVLATYTGTSLAMLSSVACNDDAPAGFQSQVDFSATGGITYHFQVGGFSGASGNLVFHLAQAASDVDSDGVPDASDNCPLVFNPAQTNTDAVVLAAGGASIGGVPLTGDGLGDDCDGDDDDDGWTDAAEGTIGTNALDNCVAGPGSGGDAWPPDFNMDASVTGADLSQIAGVIGQSVPPAPARRDIGLPLDGAITGADLSAVAGRIGQSCT